MPLFYPRSDFWEEIYSLCQDFIASTVPPHIVITTIYLFPLIYKYVSIPWGGYWYQRECCSRKRRLIDVFKKKMGIFLTNIFILNL